MYEVIKVVLKIGSKLQPLSIKVANEVLTLADGTKVQAICFVKTDGRDGALQYWTSEGVAEAQANVKILAGQDEIARETFAGVEQD